MAIFSFQKKQAGVGAVVSGGKSAGCGAARDRADGVRLTVDERGFTLMEVIVSIMLMTIGLLAVMQMQVVALSQTNLAYRLTTASALAESALEDVMSWDASDPRLASTSSTTTGFTFGDSPFVISNISYTVTYTLTMNTPISGMTQVVVNVVGGGRNITIQGFREVT